MKKQISEPSLSPKMSQTPEKEDYANPVAMNYVMQAAIAESSKDYYKAIALYKTALDYVPNSLTILQALAELYLKVDEASPARIHTMRALKIAPTDLKNWDLFVKVVFYQRDLQSLKAMATRWANYKDLTEAHYELLSDCFMMLGMLDKAIDILKRSGEQFGWNYQKYDKYASLLLSVNRINEATDVYRKCLQDYPDEAKTYLSLGRLAVMEKDTNKAIDYHLTYLKNQSSEPLMWLFVIDLIYKYNKVELADSVLDEALRKFPENVHLMSMDVRKWIRLKNYNRAIEQSKKIIDLDSTITSAYIDLGFIYHELQDYKNAEFVYQKGIEIDSTNILLLNNYAYLLATQNKELEFALNMVNKALEEDSTNINYIDTKAWIFYRMGEYEKAQNEIEKIFHQSADDEPISPEVWDHYGDILNALGRLDDARKMWKKALELDPTNHSIIDKIRKYE